MLDVYSEMCYSNLAKNAVNANMMFEEDAKERKSV